MINITSPKFHRIIEDEVIKLKFGTLTFTVIIKNGVPLLHTLHITRQKRLKYDKGQRI